VSHRVVVLLSGSGSNFAAIAQAMREGSLPIDIRAAVSDRPAAYGLERARTLEIPAIAVSPRDFPDRLSHDRALMSAIDDHAPDLVVCAGYMRIFSHEFVQHFADRMINIHPSLLPAYKGLHTHRRVLENGDRLHGCTVHYVTEELDGGPLVGQAVVPVLPGDTEETLAARVHRAEHRLYPEIIGWHATGRLKLIGGTIHLDGAPLLQPVRRSYVDAQN
jgi:phosphoribosylglycinamide formyltransferase-1